MRAELIEAIWIEEHQLSFAELADLSGLPTGLLQELVQAGAVPPAQSDEIGSSDSRNYEGMDRRFGAPALSVARRARRLHDDFELDASALSLVLGLMERLQEMETRLREVQAKFPHRVL